MISIAIATYNGEKYLREQLDSIYNQTYKDIEVVVSDDCSKDDTVLILEEYKSKYGLKYYVNENNLGFVKNFEKAIEYCTGDYIALCDQDDIWKKEKLEVLISNIGDYNLIYSDAELIDENGNIFFDSFMKYMGLEHIKKNQFEKLLHGNFVQGASLLFKSFLKKDFLPFPNGIPYHDWWIVLFGSVDNKILFVDKPLIQYRIHATNDTGVVNNSTSLAKFKNFLNSSDDSYEKKMSKKLNIIYAAKPRFSSKIYQNEFYKTEKFIKSMIKRNYISSILFIIRHKYLFYPHTSWLKYIWIYTRGFVLYNRTLKRVINIIFLRK